MNTNDVESYSIYPGEFIPAFNEAFVMKQVKSPADREANRPYANVKELIDQYKIEIAAPGFKREQLIVYADTNDLVVCATDKCNTMQPDNYFQKHVRLPADADVELAIAEYRNNILKLYIPKAKQPSKSGTTRIIIY